jgi:hypothetical protein
MRFQAIELETPGQLAAEFPEAFDQSASIGLLHDFQRSSADHVDLDVFTLFEIECLDYRGRKSYRKAVAPSSYLHFGSPDIHSIVCIS